MVSWKFCEMRVLLNWESDPVELPDYKGWVEFRGCQVLSANWDGIIPQQPGLFDELRPRLSASLSLEGGLRAKERSAWIEGHLPELCVSSYGRSCRIRITSATRPDDEPKIDKIIGTNTSVRLENLPAGTYRLEAIDGGRTVDSRYLSVLSWESLEPSDETVNFGIKIGEHRLHGGKLQVE